MISVARRRQVSPVAAAPTFRDKAVKTNTGFSCVVTMPGTLVVGDYMLLSITTFLQAAGGPTVTTPTGWNLVRTDDCPIASAYTTLTTFSRFTQAGDAGANVSIPLSNNASFTAALGAYIGVNAITPINVQGVAVQTVTAGTSLAAGSLTTTVPNTMVVHAWGARSTNVGSSNGCHPPVTNRASTQGVFGDGSSGSGLSDEVLATAGATATPSCTWDNNSDMICQTFALRT